jgi:hypothetical protein
MASLALHDSNSSMTCRAFPVWSNISPGPLTRTEPVCDTRHICSRLFFYSQSKSQQTNAINHRGHSNKDNSQFKQQKQWDSSFCCSLDAILLEIL